MGFERVARFGRAPALGRAEGLFAEDRMSRDGGRPRVGRPDTVLVTAG